MRDNRWQQDGRDLALVHTYLSKFKSTFFGSLVKQNRKNPNVHNNGIIYRLSGDIKLMRKEEVALQPLRVGNTLSKPEGKWKRHSTPSGLTTTAMAQHKGEPYVSTDIKLSSF